MMKLYSYRRIVMLCLSLPLLLLLLDGPAMARALRQDEVRIGNVSWKVDGDKIIITYKLEGPQDKDYTVHLVFLREKDVSFKVEVKSATGAIGEGKFSGQSNEVRWDYKKDISQDLQGDDFYVEVSAEPVSAGGGGSTLLFVGLGAAAIGGAIVLLGGKKSDGGDGGGQTELPTPPIRP